MGVVNGNVTMRNTWVPYYYRWNPEPLSFRTIGRYLQPDPVSAWLQPLHAAH